MINRFLILTTLTVLGAILTGCRNDVRSGTPTESSPTAHAAATETIPWSQDLTAALSQAKTAGKPVMVDFYATWCGPCKLLDERTYSDPEVAAAAADWISVKIDVDQQPTVAQEFGIRSIPTIIFFNPEGETVDRVTGFIDAAKMQSKLTQHAPKKTS